MDQKMGDISTQNVDSSLVLRLEEAKKNRATTLDLSGQELTQLPAVLGQLTQLQRLDLSVNRLAVVPEALGHLKQLRNLNLAYNQLTSVPAILGQLTQLQELNLAGNRLSVGFETLGQLTQLRILNLTSTGLTAVPETLGQLSQLQELNLAGNRLAIVPEMLGQLRQLHVLNLSSNQLIAVPKTLRHLISLQELYLHGNKALGIPPETLGPDQQAVVLEKKQPAKPNELLEYYFRIQDAKRPLNEGKLILVGSGNVGKTSLVRRLIINQFDPYENKTEGIKITEWPLRLHSHEDVLLHVWDFGGQEILHATHQFFLTQRSMYLLVLNGRDGGEEADADYWLRLISGFGGDSPVIVVLNKIQEHPFDVNRRALQQKYPRIRDFIKTDCADGTGLDDLRNLIKRETDQLEHLRDAFPARWFSIKTQLVKMRKNYFTFDEYRTLCSQHGETDPQAQETLAGYLHTLGIVLNYKDDPRLQNTNVLKPHWVTNGIYTILNAANVIQQQGDMHLRELSAVLKADDYPADMCRFILDLMKKFELCFSFPDDETHYLIPELLDKQEPEEASAFPSAGCLPFQYHYPVLPGGLLPRFIVRTHILSIGQPRWHTGVLLAFEDCRALVKADVQDKKVLIRVSGPLLARRRLLAIIRADFECIHRDIPHLQPQEMVPLPEYPDVVIPYRELLVMEEHGLRTFPKVVGDEVIEVYVNALLNGVDLEDIRNRERTMETPGQATRLFYSYSHKDEVLRDELEIRLRLLQRQGLLSTWHNRQIETSAEWKRQPDDNMERADIILLLVSADFLASEYCDAREIRRALERHEQGQTRVIPVIVRDVNWRQTPLATLQALPTDGRAVTRWENADVAWGNVEEGIARAIEQHQSGRRDLSKETLFITRVRIENIRCFERVDLSLLSDAGVRQFILLFGDNGVGKTTLLRSIALGLCDEMTATALLEMLPGSLLRENTKKGLIHIEFANTSGARCHIETTLQRNRKGRLALTQKTSSDFPRHRLFACGYGASRRGFGSQDYDGYSLRHSLGTLFNYDMSLQSPELAFRRLEAQHVNINALMQRIDSVLMLEPGATSLHSSGIHIRGPWGDFMPLGGLGDGFQATLGWLADMLGWTLFFSPDSLFTEVTGIVLLDELEQHLHPSWQREIIHLLHQQFPKLQFIATSHAPMCALGTTALPESLTEIVRLRQLEDHVDAIQLTIPKAQRADQVLTSPLFGLFSSSGFDVSADIQRYAQLASQQAHTDSEKLELKALGERLDTILGPFQNDLERKIERAVRQAMEKELAEVLQSGAITHKSLDFHIRHRLQKSFGQGDV